MSWHHYNPASHVESNVISHEDEIAFAAEKMAFQEEIHTLRQKSSRIEELENENRNLKCELDVRAEDSKGPVETQGRKHDDPSHVCPEVDGNKLAEAQDRLEELKNAYGQLVGAHRLMKEKYKLAQQINRKWCNYYQNMSQRPKSASSAEIEPKNISDPSNGQQTTPNVSTMSYRWSLSNASGSVLSSNEVPLYTRASSQLRDLVSGPHLPVKISPQREALDVQDIFEIPPDPESDNLAETCDESQNESIIEQSLTDQREDKVDQSIEKPARPIDNGSDCPVIVAERSLKRKREFSVKQGNREVHNEHTHPCTKRKPIRVKTEHDSSSPITPISFPGILDPQDSIDLDEVGEKHFTPRKHRRLLNERRVRAALKAPVEHRANDKNSKNLQEQNLLIEKDEENDQRFEGDIGSEEDGESDQPVTYDKAFFMKQAQAYGTRLWEEWKNQQQNNAARLKTAKSIPPKVLKTADPNIKLLPRSTGPLIDASHALPSNRRDRSSALISLLTEDGEEFSTMNERKSSRVLSAKAKQPSTKEDPSKNPGATGVNQRLGTLLAKPSPQTASLVFGSPVTELRKSTKEFSTPINSSVLRNDGKSLLTPISKSGQVAEKAAVGTKSNRSTRLKLRSRAEAKPLSPVLSRMHEPKEALSEYKSLRSRPVATLGTTDFKLNPAHNQGYGYPFSEVVRNRGFRKCMPGCKRPDCCGNIIRKAVEIGGYTSPRKRRLSNPPLEDEVEEDDRLLEDYLGDNKSHLKCMPAEERKELLLQAKIEQFANVHGKHRYVYGRMQSPPGYWDTDMPDTQKENEYRAAAMAHEIEKTAEMYKEAMRPDGLYKFRDE